MEKPPEALFGAGLIVEAIIRSVASRGESIIPQPTKVHQKRMFLMPRRVLTNSVL
jgi:hypothetical protein